MHVVVKKSRQSSREKWTDLFFRPLGVSVSISLLCLLKRAKVWNGFYVPALNTLMDLNEDGINDVVFYQGTKPNLV